MSASGTAAATEAVRFARELNPEIYVVARADYLRDTDSLLNAGANEVFSGEGEVALTIAESILRHFGVDDFAERVRVERDTAVITIFRLEAARYRRPMS